MPGIFLLTLDTELAWGTYDIGGLTKYKKHFSFYRKNVDDLIGALERYKIKATWAFVGQLFLDGDETWHAPDLLEKIKKMSLPQEIANHTFSHIVLGRVSKDIARFQIKKTMDLAKKENINIKSLVFPRNSIAYLDVLKELGIKSFRGYKKRKIWQYVFNQVFPTTPPVYNIEKLINYNGVLEIPESMFLMPYDGARKIIPSFSRRIKVKKGLKKAIATNGLFHLWFHPFNLGSSPKMISDLEYILSIVRQKIDSEEIVNMTMNDLTNFYEKKYGEL